MIKFLNNTEVGPERNKTLWFLQCSRETYFIQGNIKVCETRKVKLTNTSDTDLLTDKGNECILELKLEFVKLKYRVSIKSFLAYRHLLQENNVE